MKVAFSFYLIRTIDVDDDLVKNALNKGSNHLKQGDNLAKLFSMLEPNAFDYPWEGEIVRVENEDETEPFEEVLWES